MYALVYGYELSFKTIFGSYAKPLLKPQVKTTKPRARWYSHLTLTKPLSPYADKPLHVASATPDHRLPSQP